MSKYEELINKQKEMYPYTVATNLVFWDMQTLTPKLAMDNMVEATTALATKKFKMSISPEYGKLIDEVIEEEFDSLDELKKECVRRLKKDYDEYKMVPVDFFEKYQETLAKAQDIWVTAKKTNDYNLFKPYLENLVEMKKQLIKFRKPDCKDIYDAMLDDYEEGMHKEIIDKIFAEIKEELIPFVKDILSKPAFDESKFKGNYSKHKQEEISRMLLEYMGFDFKHGAIAESEHPFTMSVSHGDARITNHYYEDDIINPMYSIIHEGGHGIFEQNIDEKYYYTPMENINFLGLHESQSRFYENILGRNINFWKPIYSKIQDAFDDYKDITLEEFYRQINNVKQNLIRIDSDEVTYCFHIILRYEIEKELFAGNITVDELPKIWADKMEEYIGIRPKDDTTGVLQDSHWSGGSFGYFPSYLLGSIYDGMFIDAINEKLGDIDEILAAGDIKKITKFLNENIHQYGSFYKPNEVIKNVCQKELSAKPLIKYFKDKYSKIYDL